MTVSTGVSPEFVCDQFWDTIRISKHNFFQQFSKSVRVPDVFNAFLWGEVRTQPFFRDFPCRFWQTTTNTLSKALFPKSVVFTPLTLYRNVPKTQRKRRPERFQLFWGHDTGLSFSASLRRFLRVKHEQKYSEEQSPFFSETDEKQKSSPSAKWRQSLQVNSRSFAATASRLSSGFLGSDILSTLPNHQKHPGPGHFSSPV